MSSQPQRFSAGFWDSDRHSVAIRRTFALILLRGTILTALVIMGALSIYWGALWKLSSNIHHLSAWVVDFDGSDIGQAVQRAAVQSTGPLDKLSWTVIPASRFPNGPSGVMQAVFDEKCWVAIVVNPNATSRLDNATSTFDVAYDGSQAVTIYTIQARSENAYSTIIVPQSQQVMMTAAASFANQHAQRIASNPNISSLLLRAPTIVTRPWFFTLNNIRPFNVTAATAADFVGLIYLLIISFIFANLHYAARMGSGLENHLRLRSLIITRIIVCITAYFILTFCYSLVSLIFQIPFNRQFQGGFMIFWMMGWMAMCALGLAIEAVATLVTLPFTAYFIVLWIIVNISVCFYPIELLPGIFKYGYSTPFYNVNRTVRTLIFGTRNQIGLNFGVQFAWIAISLVTIPLIQWYRRRTALQEWQGSKEESPSSVESPSPSSIT